MHALTSPLAIRTTPSAAIFLPVQKISLSDRQAPGSVSPSVVLAYSPKHKAQDEAYDEAPQQKWESDYVAESFYAQGRRVMFAWAEGAAEDRPHVELFKTATGKHLASLVGLDVAAEREFNLSHAVIAPDGSRVFLSGINADGFYALDIPHQQVAWYSGYGENEDVPEEVAVSANSKYLLLDLTYTVELRSMQTGKRIKTLLSFPMNANPPEGVGTLAFSPDGKYAVATMRTTGSEDTLLLWSIPAGKQVHKFYCPAVVIQVLFSPDGQHLLTLSTDPKNPDVYKSEAVRVRIWNWRAGRLIRQFSIPIEHLPGGGYYFPHAAFTPDGKQLLASGKFLSIWDVATGRQVGRFPSNGARPGWYRFYLSPNGRYILSGGQLWRFPSGKLIRTFPNP